MTLSITQGYVPSGGSSSSAGGWGVWRPAPSPHIGPLWGAGSHLDLELLVGSAEEFARRYLPLTLRLSNWSESYRSSFSFYRPAVFYYVGTPRCIEPFEGHSSCFLLYGVKRRSWCKCSCTAFVRAHPFKWPEQSPVSPVPELALSGIVGKTSAAPAGLENSWEFFTNWNLYLPYGSAYLFTLKECKPVFYFFTLE